MTAIPEDPNPTVLDLVRQSQDLQQISADIGEVLLDEFLAGGLAKDIPVLNTIFGVVRAAGTYSNFLLAKKIAIFLKDLNAVPQEQRQKQVERLMSDQRYSHQVADNLMLVLDRLNDMSKPLLLASAWRAYLDERIDRNMLFRFTRAIELLHVDDLSVLHDLVVGQSSTNGLRYVYAEWKDGGMILCPIDDSPVERAAGSPLDWDRLQHLAMCGLLMQDFGRGGGVGGRHAGLRLSEVGRSFYQNVVANSPPLPPGAWPTVSLTVVTLLVKAVHHACKPREIRFDDEASAQLEVIKAQVGHQVTLSMRYRLGSRAMLVR